MFLKDPLYIHLIINSANFKVNLAFSAYAFIRVYTHIQLNKTKKKKQKKNKKKKKKNNNKKTTTKNKTKKQQTNKQKTNKQTSNKN